MTKPTIVTLCGSTRFKEAFIEANFRETMAGRIVLSVGWFSHTDRAVYQPTEEEKRRLDELHLAKIDISDEILVINCKVKICPECRSILQTDIKPWKTVRIITCSCGADLSDVPEAPYIGESTRREIQHAVRAGKRVRYLIEKGQS